MDVSAFSTAPRANTDDIIKAVASLEIAEIRRIAVSVADLIEERVDFRVRTEEELLIKKIKTVFPKDALKRQKALFAKHEVETITDAERIELKYWNDLLENKAAERMGFLIELAKIRNISVAELAKHPT